MDNFIEIIKIGMGDYSLHHLAWHLLIVAFCIVTTGVFSVADTISGIYTAKKTGEKLRSHRLRKTFEKMVTYWFFQILVAIVGVILSLISWYNLPYFSIILALVICYTEGCSMWEHCKRRRDGVTKIQETMQELIDLVGGEEELKRTLISLVQKRLGVEGCEHDMK